LIKDNSSDLCNPVDKVNKKIGIVHYFIMDYFFKKIVILFLLICLPECCNQYETCNIEINQMEVKSNTKKGGANKKRKQVEELVSDNSSDSHNLKDDTVLYCKSIISFYIMLLFTILF
jgi:hypothetical protein